MQYEVITAGGTVVYMTSDLATAVIEMMSRAATTGGVHSIFSETDEMVASSVTHPGETVILVMFDAQTVPSQFMVSRSAAFPILDQLGVKLDQVGIVHSLCIATI